MKGDEVAPATESPRAARFHPIDGIAGLVGGAPHVAALRRLPRPDRVRADPARTVDRHRSCRPTRTGRRVLFFPIGTYILLAVGLNIVVGQAGLLDLGLRGVLRDRRLHVGVFGTKLRLVVLADRAARHLPGRGVGRHPRRADAAAARRLPGDRDARVRRDRPDHREQHRRASAAPRGITNDPAPAADLRPGVPARPGAVLLPDAGRDRARDRLLGAAAARAASGGRGPRSARTRTPPS